MTGTDVDFYFRIVTARGALKHVRGMARVMEQVAGRPLFIGALQDVTESRTAEEAVNRARSELTQVARVATLNTLTASIAHEVNQPLAGIITNASTCLWMLNDDPPDVSGARETVRRTIRDGERAAHVIGRLRALFSRKEFTQEPLDLNEATREVIELSLSDLRANRVVAIAFLMSAFPSAERERADSITRKLHDLLPQANPIRVFCPGVIDLPEPGNPTGYHGPTASSLGQAIEICVSWREARRKRDLDRTKKNFSPVSDGVH